MHISSNDESFGYRSTLMDGAMVRQWWNAQCNEVHIWLFMSWMTSPTSCPKSLPTLLTSSWMKFMHDYSLFIHMDDIHSMFIHFVIKKALKRVPWNIWKCLGVPMLRWATPTHLGDCLSSNIPKIFWFDLS
jgi:hypothetical protein